MDLKSVPSSAFPKCDMHSKTMKRAAREEKLNELKIFVFLNIVISVNCNKVTLL